MTGTLNYLTVVQPGAGRDRTEWGIVAYDGI